MSWKICEKAEDKGGVKEWSLFVLMDGEQHPSSTARPFRKGHWFFGKNGGDPAGHRIYRDGLKEARAEVERLNQLSGESLHQ
ncbi:MAG: hypothetical protein NTY05_14795 [Rhodocyclales bacterium]|nr:hypothetical protein [Rhodocyclales bacterium]